MKKEAMDITKNIGILPDILSKNDTEAIKTSNDTFEMKTKNGHVAAIIKIGDSIKIAFKNKLKKPLPDSLGEIISEIYHQVKSGWRVEASNTIERYPSQIKQLLSIQSLPIGYRPLYIEFNLSALKAKINYKKKIISKLNRK